EEYPFPHVRKGEISRFPYAVLEIKTSQREHVSSNSNGTTKSSDPHWVGDLMKSHLVKEAPRFSKYAHGVSVLFEAYVNLLPFWLSEMDEDIRRDPQKVYEEQEHKAKSGKKVVWEPRQALFSGTSTSKGKDPALDELSPVPEITVTEPKGAEHTIRPTRSIGSLLGLV